MKSNMLKVRKIKRILWQIVGKVGKVNRYFFYSKKAKKDIKNKEVTIISHNCLVGVWYHDLGLKFLSPTINLYIMPDHFIKFVSNLKYYLDQPLVFISQIPLDYPVALLDDIFIFFVHYQTAEEAEYCWNKRKNRINWDNIFVALTDRFGGYNENILKDFSDLPYKKVYFTTQDHGEYPFIYQIKELEKFDYLPCPITEIVSFTGKRLFECSGFDPVRWLNGTDD